MNTTQTTPKDFFLHLGATVALYAAATALINLLFAIINYYFPDQLAGYFYGNSVAWPISMLIVLIPILYVLEWLVDRDTATMPEKRDLWIRKWRFYLTLFLAVILLGGDLIALINVYLNGEITARFIWKIVAIILVAGTIGKYYFFSLYTNFRVSRMMRRGHAWFGVILVIAAIVMGFIAVGSPAKQRALRLDSQRVNDLSNIQWQIVNYWQNKEKLPASLDDLKDPISGAIIPTDPETKLPYEYSMKGMMGVQGKPSGLSFSLCGTFSRATPDLKGRGDGYGSGGMMYPMMAYDSAVSYPYPGPIGEDTWMHQAGRTCFDRTIDPDKYPVNKPIPLKQ